MATAPAQIPAFWRAGEDGAADWLRVRPIDGGMRAAAAARPLAPLRDYIGASLYGAGGYFASSVPPVLARPGGPLSDLPNRAAYERVVGGAYARAGHGWATPAELFSPWLGRAVANRIAAAVPEDRPVRVVELGGGRGTLAKDVLACVHSRHPAVADRLVYSLVDISQPLAKLQEAAVAEEREKGARVEVHVGHSADWLRNLMPEEDAHYHVLATEVLDNLPHDLLRISSGHVSQAYSSPAGPCEIVWSDQLDPLTASAADAFRLLESDAPSAHDGGLLHAVRGWLSSALDGGVTYAWVPTTAHILLRSLASSIPSASVTLTDFAHFPGALPHVNGPVLQRVGRGVATVYDSIEAAPFGQVDIMFPTHFAGLESAYRDAVGADVRGTRVVSQQGFFEEFASAADVKGSTCGDGFNPVLHDFQNVSFFLAG